MTRISKVEGLTGLVRLIPGVLGLTSSWVALVVTFVKSQSWPSIRYPMRVVSVVRGPKVMATC